MPSLEITQRSCALSSFDLDKDILTIGRAGDNDIVLPDKWLRVSRYHAALLRNPRHAGSYTIRDLSSSHGTMVAGQKVARLVLADDQEIRIGDFSMRYRVSPQATRAVQMIDAEPLQIGQKLAEAQTRAITSGELMGWLAAGKDRLAVDPRLREFVSQAVRSGSRQSVATLAVDFLFSLLDMGQQRASAGCLAEVMEDGTLRFLSERGLESVRSFRLPYQRIREGQVYRSGNLLAVPVGQDPSGVPLLLFLQRGTSGPAFGPEDQELASQMARLVGRMLAALRDRLPDVPEESDWPGEMVGADEVHEQIMQLAASDANVLITGPTGVGKELAARALHRLSPGRYRGPLVIVNSASIPKDLFESELFGHRKGAFTGAVEGRKGSFELADGGTLVLDEVTELPPDCQAKVLRAIEYKAIQKVGSDETQKVDVRIVAATNQNLVKLLEDGRFRSDLRYRFGGLLAIRPLRERKRDVALLAHFFLDACAREAATTPPVAMTHDAMRELLEHDWPGNVRELRSVIGKALADSGGPVCGHHVRNCLRADTQAGDTPAAADTAPVSLAQVEEQHIRKVLAEVGGNKEETARRLGVSKVTVYEKMKRYDIPLDFGQ